MAKPVKYDQSVLYEMNFLELMGAIFIRSQIIEQLIREMILATEAYQEPKDFDKKTFGQLLKIFEDLYPEIKQPKDPKWPTMTLYEDLRIAKEARDEAAHGDFLVHLSVIDLLTGEKVKEKSIDRLTLKAARKSAMAMDDAVFKLWNFRANLAG